VPRDAGGQRIDFWIVGMGKLGARELNVSSDIDLIYVYEDDGQTDGIRPSTAVEAGSGAADFGARVLLAGGQAAVRTDRRHHRRRLRVPRRPGAATERQLRPAGGQPGHAGGVPAGAGPRMGALRLAEEPRRRARASVASGRALALRSLVTPFVYRRYLDYGVFEGLRQLHRKIRDEAQRRAAGRPERANDVKLSRGGIREIEFIVQLMLVVRGGQFPEIRTRSTLRGAEAAGRARPDEARDRAQLAAGYASCAGWNTASSTSTTSRRTCCPPPTATWPGSRPAWACLPSTARRLRAAGPPGRGARAGGRRVRRAAGRGRAPAARGGCRTCGPAPQPVDSESLLEQLPPSWPSV
jgi:glutamate-ammonia-ligase adenylyltransferase